MVQHVISVNRPDVRSHGPKSQDMGNKKMQTNKQTNKQTKDPVTCGHPIPRIQTRLARCTQTFAAHQQTASTQAPCNGRCLCFPSNSSRLRNTPLLCCWPEEGPGPSRRQQRRRTGSIPSAAEHTSAGIASRKDDYRAPMGGVWGGFPILKHTHTHTRHEWVVDFTGLYLTAIVLSRSAPAPSTATIAIAIAIAIAIN